MAPGMMIVDNNPNVTHWSLEGGYDDETNKEFYPNRIFNANPGGALNIDFHLSNQGRFPAKETEEKTLHSFYL